MAFVKLLNGKVANLAEDGLVSLNRLPKDVTSAAAMHWRYFQTAKGRFVRKARKVGPQEAIAYSEVSRQDMESELCALPTEYLTRDALGMLMDGSESL